MRWRTARTLDKLVVLLATLCLAANTYHVPSVAFWTTILNGRSYLLVVLLAVVGVFGVLAPIEALSARSRIETAVTIRRQILNSFGRLLTLGTEVAPHLEMSDLGLHIWKRTRTLRHPIRGVLSRVATYRVGTNPVVRRFTPTKGVGVVGLCWKLDQELGVNVEQLATNLNNEQEYEEYISQHGKDAVMNLSWQEFYRVRHRGAVFASPIRNARNRFIGCISVDASHGFETLDRSELKGEMSLLCIVIGQAGFENS